MAIDVLSRMGSSPIVVGDGDDMVKVKGLFKQDDGQVYLHYATEKGTEEIQLSLQAQENMLSSLEFIAVALTPENEIMWAFKCRMNEEIDLPDSRGGVALENDELKELAEDLVAGDFVLDFLRDGGVAEKRECETND